MTPEEVRQWPVAVRAVEERGCPFCHVLPMQPCESGNGRVLPLRQTHIVRCGNEEES